jgi:hypothetical protein
MRSALLKAASLALTFLFAAVALARAGVDIQAASETNGQIVVRLDNHELPTFSPVVSFYVAIGPTGNFTASFLSGPPASDAKGGALSAVMALDTLTTSTPFSFRGARVIWVKVQIPGNTSVSHVVIDYTPAATVETAATADPLLRNLVVNRNVFPIQPSSGAPAAWFSLTTGWANANATTFSNASPNLISDCGSAIANRFASRCSRASIAR